MRFITYGNADLPPVMMIHGMATTAEICYDRIAKKLSTRYHVILAVLDGHDDKSDSIFVSVDDSCKKIERYVSENFGGHLYAISGFSLGGSIAVELLQRGNISIEKAHLDAAFCIKLGALAPVYTFIFTEGIRYIQSGRKVPESITGHIFGKGNNSVIEMLFYDIKRDTILNGCHDVYRFELREELRDCGAETVFWFGSNEKFPRKTARLLRKYMPKMKVCVFKGMGHGQLLHEHPDYYLKRLTIFLKAR
ncbi:MAG: alpha/beta hydrolase [Ruminiclostridium sp.]|nr:alpha/beta hydrolase [Ruminiclostridium sp.]